MGAIDNFLKRRGYAKLDRYGLVLTPDERVLSARPAVLDDGLGGKIVGWVDGDLAAMELDKWSPAAMPAAAKTVAVTGRLQQAPALPKAPAQRPLPGVAPIAAAPAAPAVAAAPAAPAASVMAAPAPAPVAAPMFSVSAPTFSISAPMMSAPAPASPAEDDEADWERLRRPAAIASSAPVVAAEPELTEDEWEWEIAMARVRAAADQVSESASAMQFTKPKGPPPRTLQMAAAAPSASSASRSSAPKPFAPMTAAPKTMPMAAVAMARPEPMPAWPKTEPHAESWDERTEATPPYVPPVEQTVAAARRSTVIPVPQLPVAARPSDVRPPPSTRTISPRTRLARGTAREDTVQIQAAPQVHDDNTSPYVTLPSEVRSPGYAHTKRAAAKHR